MMHGRPWICAAMVLALAGCGPPQAGVHPDTTVFFGLHAASTPAMERDPRASCTIAAGEEFSFGGVAAGAQHPAGALIAKIQSWPPHETSVIENSASPAIQPDVESKAGGMLESRYSGTMAAPRMPGNYVLRIRGGPDSAILDEITVVVAKRSAPQAGAVGR